MVLIRHASPILLTLQQPKEKLKSDNTHQTSKHNYIASYTNTNPHLCSTQRTAINGYYNTLPITYITITSKLPTNYSANITKLIP